VRPAAAGVARRCCVQHHKGILALRHRARKRAEHGDFFRAGRTQIFFNRRAIGVEIFPAWPSLVQHSRVSTWGSIRLTCIPGIFRAAAMCAAGSVVLKDLAATPR